jgi:hypothetical protein
MANKRLVLLGLNALARAHELDYFADGHRGAGMVAVHLLCVNNGHGEQAAWQRRGYRSVDIGHAFKCAAGLRRVANVASFAIELVEENDTAALQPFRRTREEDKRWKYRSC